MQPGEAPITELLQRWRAGDRAAADSLLPVVYERLRAIARRQLARERGQSLVPTELVHEAYLQLSAGTPPQSHDRMHFFALAARAMRQVLVAHARHRGADKRQGGERLTLSSADPPDPSEALDLLALDQALNALEAIDPRRARVIELRAFAGLDFDEIVQVMDMSRATLARDFRAARAWLYRELQLAPPPERAD